MRHFNAKLEAVSSRHVKFFKRSTMQRWSRATLPSSEARPIQPAARIRLGAACHPSGLRAPSSELNDTHQDPSNRHLRAVWHPSGPEPRATHPACGPPARATCHPSKNFVGPRRSVLALCPVSRSSVSVSGLNALCVGPWRSLCRAPALSVSGLRGSDTDR